MHRARALLNRLPLNFLLHLRTAAFRLNENDATAGDEFDAGDCGAYRIRHTFAPGSVGELASRSL
jgi:hypothetical protein